MIGASAISVAKTVFLSNGLVLNSGLFVSLFIFALACVLSLKKTHPIIIILHSASLGIISGILL